MVQRTISTISTATSTSSGPIPIQTVIDHSTSISNSPLAHFAIPLVGPTQSILNGIRPGPVSVDASPVRSDTPTLDAVLAQLPSLTSHRQNAPVIGTRGPVSATGNPIFGVERSRASASDGLRLVCI